MYVVSYEITLDVQASFLKRSIRGSTTPRVHHGSRLVSIAK